MAFLGRHCAEGRLSPAELSDRVERAYAAVSPLELDALTRDLPRYPAVPAVGPSSRARRGRAQGLGIIAVATLTVLALAGVFPRKRGRPWSSCFFPSHG